MGPSVTASATSNYVAVGVGDEIFAVDVANVREILAYRTVFHLPNAPPFQVGVIDVRGSTVPVIAPRLKLGLPSASITDDTRILALEIDVEGRQLVVGLLADRAPGIAEIDKPPSGAEDDARQSRHGVDAPKMPLMPLSVIQF
jgi:purine-binding chemotaxis protein CheW